jgi:hypothetical protein
MNGKEYGLQSFYVYLKLGIWQSGHVAGLGYAETAKVYSDRTTDKCFFIRKPLEIYLHSPLIKKHLSSGLFLLDLYCQNKSNDKREYVHTAIIAVCRTTTDSIHSVQCLRITTRSDTSKFLQLLQHPTKIKTSGSYRKWEITRSRDRINNGISIYNTKRKY